MADRVHPFSCGSQFCDWQEANCCRCTKYTDDASRCDLQAALGEAMFTDGSFDEKTAARLGYDDPLRYVWQCTEVEWSEAWQREWAARRIGNGA